MKNTDRFAHAKAEWERFAILELYSEYKQALALRKLELKPAAIEIFDSETHWGQWLASTRTIRLSRKLLRTQNWFQVCGILLHEMAHQLVDEHPSFQGSAETAHGESFHRACLRLGVPAEFAKASADLQSHNFDWREQPRDEATEKMLEKVKKLLALAESSNENEALLAMNRVRELYAKHNLEQLSSHQGADRIHIIINNGLKRIESYEQQIAGILVGHFFVEVVSGRQYDAPTGEYHRAFEIIGSRENAIMAEYVFYFLKNQSKFLLEQAEKKAYSERGHKFSRLERKSYRIGILRGFSMKLQTAQAPGEETPAENNVVRKALVAFAKDASLKDYIGRVYPRLRRGSSSTQSIDPNAYSAGTDAGKKLSIHRPITSEGPRGKLLQ